MNNFFQFIKKYRQLIVFAVICLAVFIASSFIFGIFKIPFSSLSQQPTQITSNNQSSNPNNTLIVEGIVVSIDNTVINTNQGNGLPFGGEGIGQETHTL